MLTYAYEDNFLLNSKNNFYSIKGQDPLANEVSFDSKLTIKYLNLPKILDDITIMEYLTELNSSHPLFINDVIESILIYKWENYAKSIFYYETFL